MSRPLTRAVAVLCSLLAAVGVSACASSTVSSAFKGEAREAAQAISDLQSDARADDEQKVCANDLSSALVTRLNRASGGCKEAVKKQLAEVDNFEVSVHSVAVSPSATHPTASASVTSVSSGRIRPGTLLLVKEDGRWKVSGVK